MIEILVALAIGLGAPAGVQVECLHGPQFRALAETSELADAYAMANIGGRAPTIWLRWRTCQRAAWPQDYRKVPASFELLVFAHEVAHARGQEDEHEASCEGYRQVKLAARLRGDKRAHKLRKLARWHARYSLAPTHQCRRR